MGHTSTVNIIKWLLKLKSDNKYLAFWVNSWKLDYVLDFISISKQFLSFGFQYYSIICISCIFCLDGTYLLF